MRPGWIKLHRRALDCPELHGNSKARSVWFEMMLRAAHEPCRVVWRGLSVDLRRGELVASMREMADQCGVSYQELRTVCMAFKKAGMALFNAEAKSQATRVTLCNFDIYQSADDSADNQSNAPPTHLQRTSNAQNKKEKKDSSLRSESPPEAARASPTARGGFLPDDWPLTAALIELGRNKGFTDEQIEHIHGRFCNHWHSAAGANARKRSWPKTWDNWLDRERERNPLGLDGSGHRPGLNGAGGYRAPGPPSRSEQTVAVVLARRQRAHRDQH
jgi:hypothetical protein